MHTNGKSILIKMRNIKPRILILGGSSDIGIELTNFFLRFKGPTALRKRVYRFATSDDDWQFTGGIQFCSGQFFPRPTRSHLTFCKVSASTIL